MYNPHPNPISITYKNTKWLPYHGEYSESEYWRVYIFLLYKLLYLLYFLFLWVGEKILRKIKIGLLFIIFFIFFITIIFVIINKTFNFLVTSISISSMAQAYLKKWLKWSLKKYDQPLYKPTRRNINIAPLPNLAVSESYNINDIVFLIVVALGKLISYFDWN